MQQTFVHQGNDDCVDLIDVCNLQAEHSLLLNIGPPLSPEGDAAAAIFACYHHFPKFRGYRGAAIGALNRSRSGGCYHRFWLWCWGRTSAYRPSCRTTANLLTTARRCTCRTSAFVAKSRIIGKLRTAVGTVHVGGSPSPLPKKLSPAQLGEVFVCFARNWGPLVALWTI